MTQWRLNQREDTIGNDLHDARPVVMDERRKVTVGETSSSGSSRSKFYQRTRRITVRCVIG